MKQVLFIRYRKSDQIDAGGEQGTNTNYAILCQIFGTENVIVYNIHETQPSKPRLLLKSASIVSNFLKGYYYGLNPRKVRQITTLAKKYAYVFIDRSIFGVIAESLKKEHYTGKIVTFFHNVESVYFEAKIGKNKPWCPLIVNCVTQNDQKACDYSDIIIALNERDQTEIIKRYNRKPDYLSPVVFKDKYNQAEYPAEETRNVPVCLFLGTYFPMNVRGILWFIREVLPCVNIKLQIVGKGMKNILSEIKDYPQIEVYSDVPDLQPYIESADFMLFPIFDGSGMKVKTCEALMYGKNIIGTTEAFEGYDLDLNLTGACCNTKEEFIVFLNKCSTEKRNRFNAYTRTVFLDEYSEKNRAMIFNRIFNDANN